MRLFADADYRFFEKRRTAYLVSAIATIVGLVAMAVNVATIGNWLNYGVDFTGGAVVQVRFHQPTDVADVRAALGGASAPQITRFDQDDEFVVRAPLNVEGDIDVLRGEIEQNLVGVFGAGSFEFVRTELVGPQIGRELQAKAAMAILLSFLLILVYLAFRFETRFGVAAVFATAHDVLITLGFLAVFRIEVQLPTVAALLTVLGYSLNDTIVVFDRIREHMARKGAKNLDPVHLIDRSINETLPRTVLTSGTTLAVLVALLLLGPAVLRDFALILCIGVVVGSYSSVFLASPALIEIRRRFGEGNVTKNPKPKPRPATV